MGCVGELRNGTHSAGGQRGVGPTVHLSIHLVSTHPPEPRAQALLPAREPQHLVPALRLGVVGVAPESVVGEKGAGSIDWSNDAASLIVEQDAINLSVQPRTAPRRAAAPCPAGPHPAGRHLTRRPAPPPARPECRWVLRIVCAWAESAAAAVASSRITPPLQGCLLPALPSSPRAHLATRFRSDGWRSRPLGAYVAVTAGSEAMGSAVAGV